MLDVDGVRGHVARWVLAAGVLVLGCGQATTDHQNGGDGDEQGATTDADGSSTETEDMTGEPSTDDSDGDADGDGDDGGDGDGDDDGSSDSTGTTGQGAPVDLDECLRVDFAIDVDQPLNTVSAEEQEQLCAWYQRVWQCALDEEAMCRSEALTAGLRATDDADGGVAACEAQERECLATEPAALDNLRSCLEVDVMMLCEGTLSDYLECMRDNLAPTSLLRAGQYTCEDVETYTEQATQEWMAPASCEAFTATCSFDTDG